MQRFAQEGKTLARVSHPNVISVFAIGEDKGVHYLSMELVRGKNLREFLGDREFLIRELKGIFVQLAEGLAAIHEKGVIHRDLKLSNILVTSDRQVKIGDFGIAKISENVPSDLTNSGQLIGTLQYLAPELFRGGKFSFRTDVYSVGLMFYELLFGSSPFLGQNHAETIDNIKHKELLIPYDVFAFLPWEMRQLLEQMVAKSPEQRIESGCALARLVPAAVTNFPTAPGLSSWPENVRVTGMQEALDCLAVQGCIYPVEQAYVLGNMLAQRRQRTATSALVLRASDALLALKKVREFFAGNSALAGLAATASLPSLVTDETRVVSALAKAPLVFTTIEVEMDSLADEPRPPPAKPWVQPVVASLEVELPAQEKRPAPRAEDGWMVILRRWLSGS